MNILPKLTNKQNFTCLTSLIGKWWTLENEKKLKILIEIKSQCNLHHLSSLYHKYEAVGITLTGLLNSIQMGGNTLSPFKFIKGRT